LEVALLIKVLLMIAGVFADTEMVVGTGLRLLTRPPESNQLPDISIQPSSLDPS
jgi:hypothetical protein